MSKQFTRREKFMLLLLSLILLAAAYYWFIQLPVSNSLTAIGYAQQDTDDIILVLEAKEMTLVQMRAELEEVFAAPSPVETPDYNNLEQLMVFLNTIMASTENYSLNFAQVDNAAADSVIRRVINMSFTCPSYEAARQVIVNLHDSPFRCQLGALTLTPVQQENTAAVAAPVPTVKPKGKAAVTPVPTPAIPARSGLLAGSLQVSLSITFFEAL